VRHAFTAAVAGLVPGPRPPETALFLRLLDRRLSALAEVAVGKPVAPARLGADRGSRALARRFLRRYEGSWDDGDENLVRGHLDRWSRPGEDSRGAAARSLLAAAEELSRIKARWETLAFLLWEMESMLTLPGDLARIPGHQKARPLRGGR
jgi:hypothetical protein